MGQKNLNNYFILQTVADSQSINEVLIERATGIVQRAKADVERLHFEGKGHLVADLEKEIQLVEKLAEDLKDHPVLGPNVLQQHEVHQIAQQLLLHENNILEQVHRIELNNGRVSLDRQHFLERAEALLARAFSDLEQHRAAGRGHLVAEIEHEVTQIEVLVYELREHPSNILESNYASGLELRLTEHERLLYDALRRIEESISY